MNEMLAKKIETINSLQAFLSKNQLSNFTEQSLNEDFKLKYTYDSNAIEGNTKSTNTIMLFRISDDIKKSPLQIKA